MNKEEVKTLQQYELAILKNVHAVCVKNNLRYYLIGGTALGAVRHKGFIPWDPDIDIAMPREDYDKFIDISGNQLDSQYKCVTYRELKNYIPPHAVVYDRNTRLEQRKKDYFRDELRPTGVYIDIMPLDVAPSDGKSQIKHSKKIRLIRKVRSFKIFSFGKDRNFVIQTLRFSLKIVLSMVSMHWLNKKMDAEFRRYGNISRPEYWCSMASHYSYQKQCMPIEIYGTPTLIQFEDDFFYAPEKVDDYLRRIYGDYMTLPPIAAQERMWNHFVSFKHW